MPNMKNIINTHNKKKKKKKSIPQKIILQEHATV